MNRGDPSVAQAARSVVTTRLMWRGVSQWRIFTSKILGHSLPVTNRRSSAAS